MRYLIIPLDSALPAVADALGQLGDERALTAEEHAALCRLAVRFVLTSRSLETLAGWLNGRPILS